MLSKRAAGILLHPTSLPGKYGIGDFGKAAYDFINFLEVAGQTFWQILPLCPTGYGNSPYQSPSAFAGNEIMISPDHLVKKGFIKSNLLNEIPLFNKNKIEFEKVIEYKTKIFDEAYITFLTNDFPDEKKLFEEFCNAEKYWLDDYALFGALKDFFDDEEWTEWEKDIRDRTDDGLKKYTEKLKTEINYYKFLQYLFYQQWSQLKTYANKKGIKIIGDMPIFVSFDSADVWANKHLFELNKNNQPKYVAGVPPDYFSATGQLWGNPHYNWKEMEKDEYSWWRLRFKSMLNTVDIIRIDHFRGFYDYWQVPGDAETAEKGKWVKGPAEKFFDAILKHFGNLPIIAEDLGLLHQGVFDLRDKYNFPGMKILQFAFGKDGDKLFLPHSYVKNCIVYTGTHDNNTTLGWWNSSNDELKEWCKSYIGSNGKDIVYDLIKTAFRSVANVVIIPFQDYLRLDESARMNFPSTLGDNWSWRFDWFDVPYTLNKEINELVKLFERQPEQKRDKSKD